MNEIMAYIRLAANYFGVDELLLAGALLLVVGAVGRQTVKAALGFVAGSHLKVGEVANTLLRLLEDPTKWSRAPEQNAENKTTVFGPGGVYVDPVQSVAFQGEGKAAVNLTSYLNRRERRMVRQAAEAVLGSCLVREKAARHQAVVSGLRRAENEAGLL